jgi:fumarate reductase subunit C
MSDKTVPHHGYVRPMAGWWRTDPFFMRYMVVHAHSWFEIMPKTMPMLFAGGKRVGEATIMRTGWTAAVVASLALLALAWWLRP